MICTIFKYNESIFKIAKAKIKYIAISIDVLVKRNFGYRLRKYPKKQ
jgi:hypothetical protein